MKKLSSYFLGKKTVSKYICCEIYELVFEPQYTQILLSVKPKPVQLYAPPLLFL